MPRRARPAVFRSILAIVSCLCAAHAAAAVSVTDDRGVVVTLEAPAGRIVTLAPHLAEIAFAAGAGGRVVGVARYSDFPAAVRGIAQIGDAARVDTERILALEPDLVLGWNSGNQASDIARLERLGLRVFVTEPRRLADVPRAMRAVGRLAGTAQRADAAAAAWEEALARLRERHASRRPLRVFYEIWHRPLLTVNGKHFISDVIATCGGVNVFDGVPGLTPTVSLEAVAAARPDAILGGGSAAKAEEFAAQWQAAPIAALRDVPAVYVPPDEIQRAGPRLMEGARLVCEALETVRSGAGAGQRITSP